MSDERKETLLEFPCEFPIKMMGRDTPEFRETARALIEKHVGKVDDDAVQDGYGLINARADYSFGADGQWILSLWGRNLSDEEIISNNIITAPLYNSLRVGSMLPPRTYGVTASYAF